MDKSIYLATSDTLQGLVVQGRTIAEAVEIAQDVARKLIESYIEHGDPLAIQKELAKQDFRYLQAQTLQDHGRMPLKRISRIDSMQLIIAGILIDSIVGAFQ